MPPDIGSRIRGFRKQRGLTQTELAEQMHQRGHTTFNQKRQSEIELGLRSVSADEAIAYARILGVPITQLLGVPDTEQNT